jgi:hypothetical protein
VRGLWAWAPGPIIRRPYYAPALVVFIGGPRHHQAWFPLGWHEPYYPRYRHSDRYLREVNIANVRSISNVDNFVDVRRADHIDYTNRQATTVVSSDVFGRRPVTHEVASVTPDEIAHAPIVRDRWEPPRLGTSTSPAQGTTVERASPFRQRRDLVNPQAVSQPTRVTEATRPEPVEPRRNSPFIYRNSPPPIARRPASQELPRSSFDTPTRQSSEPLPVNRGRTVIRRNEPTPLPSGSDPVDRARRPVLTRPTQTTIDEWPMPRASSPRESTPRVSTPRQSSPRESSPRESSPRQASPPRSEPRGRAPSSIGSGGAQRLPSRRPPA